MRIAVAGLLCGLATAAIAQDAVPDLKGTWIGTSKAVVFGNNAFHPGTDTPSGPPRVREVEFTMEITGQDGRVFWGQAWSNADPSIRETLALALAADGRTIVGADSDGAHYMTLVSPDRIERCYANPGTSPSGSIVAACGFYERMR
ncbi:MAG TPA: hypothetical protein VFK86_06740 [Bauldia sp.]|nr:hypothetical protein [Bauldia sp.]